MALVRTLLEEDHSSVVLLLPLLLPLLLLFVFLVVRHTRSDRQDSDTDIARLVAVPDREEETSCSVIDARRRRSDDTWRLGVRLGVRLG